MEDEIVFLQPLGGVRLDQRGSGALEFFLDDAGGEALEVGVPHPAAGKLDEFVPVAGKGQLEDHADHAVVEVFDLALQALAAFEDQRLEGFLNRRTLEANVSGSHMLKAGVDGARAEDSAKFIEPNFFANVELDQHQDGAAQLSARGGLAATRVGRASAGTLPIGWRGDCGFMIHTSAIAEFSPETSPHSWTSGETSIVPE